MIPASLPDDARLYSPDLGREITAGDVRGRDRDLDSRARTVAMWGYIVTHPGAKPWLTRNCGLTPAGRGE